MTSLLAGHPAVDDSQSVPFENEERRMLGVGLRILAIFCLAIMVAAIKLAGQRGVHVVEILFYRQFLSLPVILIWLWMGPGFTSVRTKRIGAHISRTLLGTIGMVLNFLAVTILPLAEATAISFTVPIFATILSALVLKEATGVHRWSAVLLGFCGMLVIVGPDTGHFPPQGVAVAVAAALMVAITNIVLRQMSRTEGVATTVFWFTILSLPPLSIGLYFFGQNHDPLTWALLALIGLSGGAGQLCLTGSLRWAPVAVVIPMDYTNLIWATLLGWLIWDYLPGQTTWAGALLIVGSGLYIAWRERVRGRG